MAFVDRAHYACGGSLGGAVIGVDKVALSAVRPGDGYRLASDGEVAGHVGYEFVVAACVACRNGGGGGVRAGMYSLVIGDFGAVFCGDGNLYIHAVTGNDCAFRPCRGGSDRRAAVSVIGVGPHEAIRRKGLGIDGVSQAVECRQRIVAVRISQGKGDRVCIGFFNGLAIRNGCGEHCIDVIARCVARHRQEVCGEEAVRLRGGAVIFAAEGCALFFGQGERCFFYGEGVLVVCVDDCDIQPIALYVDTVFTGIYCICGVDSTIGAFLHLYFQLGLRHGGSIGAVVMESRDNIKVLKAVAVVDLIHALEIHFHRYIAVVKAETATRMPRLRRREVGCQCLVAGVINFNIGIYGRNFPSDGLTNFGSSQRGVFTIFPFNGYGEAGYRADGEEVAAVRLICVVIGGGFFIRNFDHVLQFVDYKGNFSRIPTFRKGVVAILYGYGNGAAAIVCGVVCNIFPCYGRVKRAYRNNVCQGLLANCAAYLAADCIKQGAFLNAHFAKGCRCNAFRYRQRCGEYLVRNGNVLHSFDGVVFCRGACEGGYGVSKAICGDVDVIAAQFHGGGYFVIGHLIGDVGGHFECRARVYKALECVPLDFHFELGNFNLRAVILAAAVQHKVAARVCFAVGGLQFQGYGVGAGVLHFAVCYNGCDGGCAVAGVIGAGGDDQRAKLICAVIGQAALGCGNGCRPLFCRHRIGIGERAIRCDRVFRTCRQGDGYGVGSYIQPAHAHGGAICAILGDGDVEVVGAYYRGQGSCGKGAGEVAQEFVFRNKAGGIGLIYRIFRHAYCHFGLLNSPF